MEFKGLSRRKNAANSNSGNYVLGYQSAENIEDVYIERSATRKDRPINYHHFTSSLRRRVHRRNKEPPGFVPPSTLLESRFAIMIARYYWPLTIVVAASFSYQMD